MAKADLVRRYRERSLWLDGLDESLEPRPALEGDVTVDVAIVGAGFTGLWTAWALLRAEPTLRVAIVEREIAGFGASGRNGGWISAGIAADPAVYAARYGADAVARAERSTYDAVAEIGAIATTEGIECDFHHGGLLLVATSEAQERRLHGLLATRSEAGAGADDWRILNAAELASRARISGARAALHSPHGARINPAKLARGLASSVEGLGGVIYERSPALDVNAGIVRTPRGRLSARSVLRATEAFTIELPGESRRFLPLYSLMVATEPLPQRVWDDLGWNGRELIADLRHLFFYAQRTADDRIALGGRGAPYALGSPIKEQFERSDEVRDRLVQTVKRHFPAAADAEITHHWGGALAIPRDWSMSVQYNRTTGLGSAGGYSGHGVVAAHLAGLTLADLVLERETALTAMPWVGHTTRNWEPEPLRFIASRSIVSIMGSADRAEETAPKTARRMKIIAPFVTGRA